MKTAHRGETKRGKEKWWSKAKAMENRKKMQKGMAWKWDGLGGDSRGQMCATSHKAKGGKAPGQPVQAQPSSHGAGQRHGAGAVGGQKCHRAPMRKRGGKRQALLPPPPGLAGLTAGLATVDEAHSQS